MEFLVEVKYTGNTGLSKFLYNTLTCDSNLDRLIVELYKKKQKKYKFSQVRYVTLDWFPDTDSIDYSKKWVRDNFKISSSDQFYSRLKSELSESIVSEILSKSKLTQLRLSLQTLYTNNSCVRFNFVVTI